jgi:hypothetical protein
LPAFPAILQKKLLTIQALPDIKIGFYSNTKNPASPLKQACGENPLPIFQFDEIYKDNIGILILGMVL